MDRPFENSDWNQGWTPPDGLDRSAPRAVGWTSKGRFVLCLAFALMVGAVAAGVGLGLVAAREANSARRFREDAVSTDAVVLRTWQTRGDAPKRWVSYRFHAAGRAYDGSARMQRGAWRALSPGSAVRVEYLPDDPQASLPAGAETGRMPPWVPALISIEFVAVGGLLLWQLGRQRRLLEEGRVVPAVVTEHGRLERGSHGRGAGKKYKYRFAVLSGAAAEGKSGPVKEPPDVGSCITVIYDRDNPRRNVPYPLSLATPRGSD